MADTARRPARSAAGTPGVLDREDLRQGSLARESRARRSRSSTPEAPQVEIGLRTRGEQIEPDVYECVLTITRDREGRRQDAVPGRGRRRPGIFTIRGVPPTEHAAACSPIALPDRAVPVRPRNDRRCGDARRLSAGAPRPDQLRGALPAAARADAAAGARRHELTTRRRWRTARSRSPRTRLRGRRALRVRWRGAARPRSSASTAEPPTVLYDAPSAKAQAAVRLGRDTPLEVHRPRRRLDQGPRRRRHDRLDRAARRSPTSASLVVRVPVADVLARTRTTRRRSSSAPSRTCCSSSPSPRRRRPRPPRRAGSRCATATASRATCASRRSSGSERACRRR